MGHLPTRAFYGTGELFCFKEFTRLQPLEGCLFDNCKLTVALRPILLVQILSISGTAEATDSSVAAPINDPFRTLVNFESSPCASLSGRWTMSHLR